MSKKTYPSETIEKISEFLFIENEINSINQIDLVVVFGSEFIKGTIDCIEELFKMKKLTGNCKIVLSGATGSLNKDKENEADRMYAEAVARGLDGNDFIVENNSHNCLENLINSKQVIEKIGGFVKFDNILFVASSFMLRRTKMGASKLDYPIEKIKYLGLVDTEGKNIGKYTWWETEEAKVRVLAELERIGLYSNKGDLSIF